jgi:ribosome-binding protein aMBF1 (putative translation factor)
MVAQVLNVGGKRFVVIEEEEYQALQERAGLTDGLPPLPPADKDGNVPALEYARASLARKVITERRRLGLSQVELAKRAGMNVETLNRIERAAVTGSVATVAKIDRALSKAAAERPRRFPAVKRR